ncbi:MAG: hypothetical protein ABL931_02700 [Usitatibacteraceae bacterium]
MNHGSRTQNDRNTYWKLQYWRGFWRHFGLKAAPVLGFYFLAIISAHTTIKKP